MTHPETLAAIKNANAAVGKIPCKYLVCSWQMYREIKEYYESDEYPGYAFFKPPAPQIAINVYGPLGGVPINVNKEWEGRRWKLCSKAQRDYILEEKLRGSKKDPQWDPVEKMHWCCESRTWYRHRYSCPLCK